MRASFKAALAAVLTHEGGYVNNPHDPGGATNRGVTQDVYDDWRQDYKLPKQSVKLLAPAEICAIYKHRYWDAIKGDELPAGVDYCIFDFAVNSGTKRAAKFLQRAAKVADDGIIGPATIAALKAADPLAVISDVCAARLAFLKQLPTWKHFGKGWGRRVVDVEKAARGMVC